MLAFGLLVACAAPRSPTSVQAAVPPVAAAPSTSPLQLTPVPGLRATLSAADVRDAGLLHVQLELASPLSAGVRKKSVLHAQFAKRKIPFLRTEPGHYEAYVGIPYLRPAGEAKLVFARGELRSDRAVELVFHTHLGHYGAEEIKVDPKHVRPQDPAILKRVALEQRAIGKAYRIFSPEKRWRGPFRFPAPNGFTSPFGAMRLYNGVHQNSHLGLDLRAAEGAPIVAPAGATVVYAADTFFLGNMLILDHGWGLKTVYGHLSKLSVHEGDIVQAGQELGLAGMTGRASGPHLHWMAVIHGEKVDPEFLTTEVLR